MVRLDDNKILITMGDSGKIIDVQGNCKHLLGWESNELINQDLEIIIPFKHRERRRQLWNGWLKSGEKKIVGTWMSIELRHKEGKLIYMNMVLTEKINHDSKLILAFFFLDENKSKDNLTSSGIHSKEYFDIFSGFVL